MPHLAKALQLLAHCGVPGNYQAYTLAMEGAHTEQPGVNVSYQENATITKARMMPSQEKDTCNLLVGPSK